MKLHKIKNMGETGAKALDRSKLVLNTAYMVSAKRLFQPASLLGLVMFVVLSCQSAPPPPPPILATSLAEPTS